MSSLSRFTRLQQLFARKDRVLLLASLAFQIVLGALFGHLYDIRISMATGYLVAAGLDPYIPQNLTTIFHNSAFQNMTSIGYPPPWPLLLGLIYKLSYTLVNNLLVYNLAIKLPIIISNLCLAYLVRSILQSQGASPNVARRAWVFLLFNPFLLYFTTAWGQFDSLVALLTLIALVLLDKRKFLISAIVLALAISLKPTPVPVVLAVILYLWGPSWRHMLGYLAALTISLFFFCILPFVIFHWDPGPILSNWNAQFTVSGGLSLTTLYELFTDSYTLPGNWWLLGVVWLPVVLVGAAFLPRGNHGLLSLFKNSLVLILLFFLTRTWLSEPNLALILPLVLILTSLGELPRLCLTAVWVLPLIFTVFNTSPPQLLFPIAPQVMNSLLQWMDSFRTARLALRMLVVIPWLYLGWWMIIQGYKKERLAPA